MVPMREKTIQEGKTLRKHCLGATVVEAIVALVIFATFIAGATQVILAHRQLSDKARAHYTAINLAKNHVEQVRNMRRADYAQILAMTENGVQVNAEGDPDSTNGKFRRTTTITVGTNNIYRLEIEVMVEIKNPITLAFEGENEHVKSYMAHLL